MCVKNVFPTIQVNKIRYVTVKYMIQLIAENMKNYEKS